MATILIVDDSQTARVIMKKSLEDAGHRVIEAVNGEDGLRILKSTEGIDLVLSDVNMPIMNGLEMCELIVKDEKLAAIPRLMLTTEHGEELKVRGKRAGVTAWVTKPFRPEKVITVIGKILAKDN